MSVCAPSAVRSIQEHVIRPDRGPVDRSASQAGYTNAPRNDSAGIPMSNWILLKETTRGVPQVAPPSSELLKTIAFCAMSFQATYTSPCGPVVTVAPMECPCPLGPSTRAVEKLDPPSLEFATWTPPAPDPPIAASQATYTLSRNGLPAFWSAVIIGLSLKWLLPPAGAKNVGCG